MMKGDFHPLKLQADPGNLLESNILTSVNAPSEYPKYSTVASFFEQTASETKNQVINLPINKYSTNLFSTKIMTDTCQTDTVASAADPRCFLRKAAYPAFQAIIAKHSEILIFSDAYSYIQLTCNGHVKTFNNEGVLVLELMGPVIVEYNLNQVYRTNSVMSNCSWTKHVNKKIPMVTTPDQMFFNQMSYEITRDVLVFFSILSCQIYIIWSICKNHGYSPVFLLSHRKNQEHDPELAHGQNSDQSRHTLPWVRETGGPIYIGPPLSTAPTSVPLPVVQHEAVYPTLTSMQPQRLQPDQVHSTTMNNPI